MGIKGLFNVITNFSQDSINYKKLSDYKGKKIAIDAEIWVYKYRSNAEKQTKFDKNNYHIYALINNITLFLKNGILPVYVFDGVPHITKQENCLNQRSKIKNNANANIKNLEQEFIEKCNGTLDINDKEILRLLDNLLEENKKNPIVTKDHRQECKYLIKLLGIPMITSNNEAETLCVLLAKYGIVDYVYTEDSDAIPFSIGAFDDHNIKSIKIIKGTGNNILEFDTLSILKNLNLTVDQFIDFCILCGCDYSKCKMNPLNALQLVHECKNIDQLGIHNYKEARSIFKINNETLPKEIIEKCFINEIDTNRLYQFLIKEKDIQNPINILDKYFIEHAKYCVYTS